MWSEIKKDIRYLTNLPGASERLQIFKADLSEPQSFDAAIEGCIGVFHVAHPVDFEEGEPQETVIRRSVEGTLGILKGCLKSKTVKRVVYTSSTAAVVYNNKDEDIMDESSWSDIDVINSIKPLGSSYVISKTRIERAALEFAEQHGLDLVSLIPSFVVGPFICPGFPGSVHLILAMILGISHASVSLTLHYNSAERSIQVCLSIICFETWILNKISIYAGNQHHYQYLKNTSMVHVDDVASAHIFLLEYPDAKGRYICSSDILTRNEMSELLSAKYPQLPIPTIEWVLFLVLLDILQGFFFFFLLKGKMIIFFSFFQFFEGDSRFQNTWGIIEEAFGCWVQIQVWGGWNVWWSNPMLQRKGFSKFLTGQYLLILLYHVYRFLFVYLFALKHLYISRLNSK